MKKLFLVIIGLLAFLLFSCSMLKKVSKEQVTKKDSTYVFDNVAVVDSIPKTIVIAKKDTAKIFSPVQNKKIKSAEYFVQLGAFTTKILAEKFVKNNQHRTSFLIKISFNKKVNLYVVRLPVFQNYNEAKRVRDKFWKKKLFNDAFIVTIVKDL